MSAFCEMPANTTARVLQRCQYERSGGGEPASMADGRVRYWRFCGVRLRRISAARRHGGRRDACTTKTDITWQMLPATRDRKYADAGSIGHAASLEVPKNRCDAPAPWRAE